MRKKRPNVTTGPLCERYGALLTLSGSDSGISLGRTHARRKFGRPNFLSRSASLNRTLRRAFRFSILVASYIATVATATGKNKQDSKRRKRE
jgi:hypothetical protein